MPEREVEWVDITIRQISTSVRQPDGRRPPSIHDCMTTHLLRLTELQEGLVSLTRLVGLSAALLDLADLGVQRVGLALHGQGQRGSERERGVWLRAMSVRNRDSCHKVSGDTVPEDRSD